MQYNHVTSQPTQERHMIGIDDDCPLIPVAGAEGIEEVTKQLGNTSKYHDIKVMMSGKSMKQAKTEGGTQYQSGRDNPGVGYNK